LAKIWGASVPESTKDASIVAAGGQVPGGAKTGNGEVFDSAAAGLGTVSGAIYSGVMPGDTTDSGIKAAGGQP
jgi:hypothetical protein